MASRYGILCSFCFSDKAYKTLRFVHCSCQIATVCRRTPMPLSSVSVLFLETRANLHAIRLRSTASLANGHVQLFLSQHHDLPSHHSTLVGFIAHSPRPCDLICCWHRATQRCCLAHFRRNSPLPYSWRPMSFTWPAGSFLKICLKVISIDSVSVHEWLTAAVIGPPFGICWLKEQRNLMRDTFSIMKDSFSNNIHPVT